MTVALAVSRYSVTGASQEESGNPRVSVMASDDETHPLALGERNDASAAWPRTTTRTQARLPGSERIPPPLLRSGEVVLGATSDLVHLVHHARRPRHLRHPDGGQLGPVMQGQIDGHGQRLLAGRRAVDGHQDLVKHRFLL